MQVRSLGWEDPLEEGLAAHASTLVWKMPWTEESGDYSPWGHKEPDTTERTHTPSIYHSTTDIHTHLNIYSHTQNHTCTPTHTFSHTRTRKYSCISMNAYVLAHSYICTCAHTHTRTHTHAHSHIHSHTSKREAALLHALFLGLIKLPCHCILTTQSGSTVNP